MASVALLMSILWIFESIPLPITALIPLILLPLYGKQFQFDNMLYKKFKKTIRNSISK